MINMEFDESDGILIFNPEVLGFNYHQLVDARERVVSEHD